MTTQTLTPAVSSGPRRRRRARMVVARRAVMAAAAIGILVAIGLAFLPEPVSVELAAVARGPMEVIVEEEGRAHLDRRDVVALPVAGRLERVELEPGDGVLQGQELARVVPAPTPLLDSTSRAQARARLAAARAAARQADAVAARARTAVEEAEIEARRQANLAHGGATPRQQAEHAEFALRARRQELASAVQGVEVARQEVAAAQAALSTVTSVPAEPTRVPSPVTGSVLRVLQESEAVLPAGTPILEVGDPGSLEIVVDVLTQDAVNMRPGTPVRVVRWGGDATLEGHVERVEPSAFTRLSALGVEEQRVNVIVVLDEAPDRYAGLRDGFRVEAHIVVWQAPDVLQAPASALFRHGDGWAVFVVEDGEAALRPVQVGRRSASRVEILGGLAAGEQVILHPGDRVNAGTDVTPR